MKKYKIPFILCLLAFASASYAGQSLGLQADMVGQGLSYRILTSSGFGAELVARGSMSVADSTYNVGGEIRLLKFFDLNPRLKIFTGLAAGAWQSNNKYWVPDTTDTTYTKGAYESFVQTGISTAVLVGLDFLIFKLGDNSGISITPEFQVGYYTLPNLYEPLMIEQGSFYYPSVNRGILPGAGIGLKYSF